MNQGRIFHDMFNFGAWVIILTTAFFAMFFAFNGYVEFDEGYNFQVPASLVSQGRYASNYDGGTLFDPYITTGPTVLLPVAAVFAITKTISVEGGRAIMALYLTGMLIAAWWLTRKMYGAMGGLLVVVILASMPDLPNLGVGVLGEVPGVFFCLVGLNLLRSKKNLLAGLCLGLAMLSKLVFALAGAALVVAYIIELWKHWKTGRQQAIRAGVVGLAGFVLPNLAWEIFKFASLGQQTYLDGLKTLLSLFINSAGLQPTSASATLAARVNTLQTPFQEISGWIVLGLIVAAAGLTGWRALRRTEQIQEEEKRPLLVFLVAFSAGYMGWWLISANMGWWRHLLPGMMVMVVPLVGLISELTVFCREALSRIQNDGALSAWLATVVSSYLLVAVVLALVVIPFQGQITRIQQQVVSFPQAKAVQMRAAQSVAELAKNGAEFGGWGWYQAPDISFLSGQAFFNLEQDATRQAANQDALNGKKIFLIVTPTQLALAPETWQSEKKIAGDLVFDEGGFQIYRFIPEYDVEDQYRLMIQRENISTFSSEYRPDQAASLAKQVYQGLFPDGWVGGQGVVWLKNEPGFTHLVVDGSVALQNFKNRPLKVKIQVMEEYVVEETLSNSGDFHWEIDLPKQYGDRPIVRISLTADQTFVPRTLGINSDGRELSFIVRLLEIR